MNDVFCSICILHVNSPLYIVDDLSWWFFKLLPTGRL